MPDRSGEAERLEDLAPGFLAEVRAAAARLGARPGSRVDAELALGDVEELARFDVNAPVLSRRRSTKAVKLGVKALSAWYLDYLGRQLVTFGDAVARLGHATMARIDALEVQARATDDRVEALRARVERLEGTGPDRA